MKKYRLIEFDPLTNNIVVKEEFKDFEKAVSKMGQYIKDDPKCFYRIEEAEGSIMDIVKSYKDACEVIGINPISTKEVILFDGDYHFLFVLPQHIVALIKLETITAALNQGWKPDFNDKSQKKWFIRYDDSVKRLNVVHTNELSYTSTRLYFNTQELAHYAAKQFRDLYKQLLTEKF